MLLTGGIDYFDIPDGTDLVPQIPGLDRGLYPGGIDYGGTLDDPSAQLIPQIPSLDRPIYPGGVVYDASPPEFLPGTPESGWIPPPLGFDIRASQEQFPPGRTGQLPRRIPLPQISVQLGLRGPTIEWPPIVPPKEYKWRLPADAIARAPSRTRYPVADYTPETIPKRLVPPPPPIPPPPPALPLRPEIPQPVPPSPPQPIPPSWTTLTPYQAPPQEYVDEPVTQPDWFDLAKYRYPGRNVDFRQMPPELVPDTGANTPYGQANQQLNDYADWLSERIEQTPQGPVPLAAPPTYSNRLLRGLRALYPYGAYLDRYERTYVPNAFALEQYRQQQSNLRTYMQQYTAARRALLDNASEIARAAAVARQRYFAKTYVPKTEARQWMAHIERLPPSREKAALIELAIEAGVITTPETAQLLWNITDPNLALDRDIKRLRMAYQRASAPLVIVTRQVAADLAVAGMDARRRYMEAAAERAQLQAQLLGQYGATLNRTLIEQRIKAAKLAEDRAFANYIQLGMSALNVWRATEEGLMGPLNTPQQAQTAAEIKQRLNEVFPRLSQLEERINSKPPIPSLSAGAVPQPSADTAGSAKDKESRQKHLGVLYEKARKELGPNASPEDIANRMREIDLGGKK